MCLLWPAAQQSYRSHSHPSGHGHCGHGAGAGPGQGDGPGPGPGHANMQLMSGSHRGHLQTPNIAGISSYTASLSSFSAQDFSINADMGLSTLGWGSHHHTPPAVAHSR